MAERDDESQTGPDVVQFRPTVARTLATMLVLAILAWLLVRLVVILVFGSGFTEEVVRESLISGVVYVVVFAGLGTWAQLRRPNQVRVSSAGVELAAARRETILVPWEAVEAVRIRRVGPFASLEVTPKGLDATATAAPRDWRPWLRRRSGRPTLVIEVGLLGPGTVELRAELTRRLPSGVVRP